MYRSYPNFAQVPDDTIVWRFMSVEKLLGLLSSQSIYFPRADKFDDPYEGIIPSGSENAIKEELPDYAARALIAVSNNNKYLFYVSCWHENISESAAMWNLYASKNSGIAIKTTIGSIKAAIKDSKNYHIFSVQYVDYSTYKTPDADIFRNVTIKRLSFKHESEVRIIHFLGFPPPNEMPNGIPFSVDTKELIKEIYIAPKAEDWLVSSINDLLLKYGIQTTAIKSNLYDSKII